MHEFLFDVTLAASIRVKASSADEARRLLRDSIDCNTANLGSWPNGDPIICEVSCPDEADEIVEIDGEPA